MQSTSPLSKELMVLYLEQIKRGDNYAYRVRELEDNNLSLQEENHDLRRDLKRAERTVRRFIQARLEVKDVFKTAVEEKEGHVKLQKKVEILKEQIRVQEDQQIKSAKRDDELRELKVQFEETKSRSQEAEKKVDAVVAEMEGVKRSWKEELRCKEEEIEVLRKTLQVYEEAVQRGRASDERTKQLEKKMKALVLAVQQEREVMEAKAHNAAKVGFQNLLVSQAKALSCVREELLEEKLRRGKAEQVLRREHIKHVKVDGQRHGGRSVR